MAELTNPDDRILVQVTEVGKCSRARQYRLCGFYSLEPYADVEPLKRHYYAIRGDIAHAVMALVFGGRETLPMASEIIDVYGVDVHMAKKLELFSCDFAGKFNSWYNSSKIDISPDSILHSEFPLFMPVGDYHILMGVPDLLLKAPRILDFKLGKRNFNRELKWQLGGYSILCSHNEIFDSNPACTNVFFGGRSAESVDYDKGIILESIDQFSIALGDFIATDMLIVQGNSEYRAPIRFSIECAFCDYRHHCRGV